MPLHWFCGEKKKTWGTKGTMLLQRGQTGSEKAGGAADFAPVQGERSREGKEGNGRKEKTRVWKKKVYSQLKPFQMTARERYQKMEPHIWGR